MVEGYFLKGEILYFQQTLCKEACKYILIIWKLFYLISLTIMKLIPLEKCLFDRKFKIFLTCSKQISNDK